MTSGYAFFVQVFRHEWRILLKDRSLWLTLGILFCVLAYGLFNGIVVTEKRMITQAKLLLQEEKSEADNIALLRRIMAGEEKPEPFGNPADPTSVGGGLATRYAMMPAQPLSPLALGQSDMLPDHYQISYRNKTTFMYDGEIENPWNLMSGRLDTVFVVVYLLPLLIIALSYNLLSAERERGTLKLVLSNPLSLTSLLAGKLLARALPLLVGASLLPLLALWIFFPPARQLDAWPLSVSWMVIVTAYGLFWFALTALVNVKGFSSAGNALLLVSSWVVLTLILPVAVNLLVSSISPAPSRVELATQTRLVTIEGLNRYSDLLSTDYRYTTNPEVLLPKDGKLEIPERLKAFYLENKDVDARINVLLDDFDRQLAGQQALVDRFGFVSPAIVAYEGITALSGTGSRRYSQFKEQIATFHQRWREYFEPRVLSGLAIKEGDFAEMPRFNWKEESTWQLLANLLMRCVQLLLPAALIVGLVTTSLRKYRVI